MAIINTTSVSKIKVLNSGDQNVVSEVEFKLESWDDTDKTSTLKTHHTSFTLDTSNVSSESPGWVEYSDLTESIIENWLGNEFTDRKQSTFNRHASWIQETPLVEKNLPW